MLNIDRELDASGLRCPLPLLKAKKALSEMQPDEVLKVIATDPGSERDFTVFVEHSNHEMLDAHKKDQLYTYVIRKGV